MSRARTINHQNKVATGSCEAITIRFLQIRRLENRGGYPKREQVAARQLLPAEDGCRGSALHCYLLDLTLTEQGSPCAWTYDAVGYQSVFTLELSQLSFGTCIKVTARRDANLRLDLLD